MLLNGPQRSRDVTWNVGMMSVFKHRIHISSSSLSFTIKQEQFKGALTPDWLETLRNKGARFVWTYMNATIALWYRTKQNSRGRLEEVVSAWFHSKTRRIRLQSEHNRPSNQTNNLEMGCLATSSKTSLVRMNNTALYFYASLLSRGSVRQSIYSRFFKINSFVSGGQHLGNVSVCPNADEAFHLLAALR